MSPNQQGGLQLTKNCSALKGGAVSSFVTSGAAGSASTVTESDTTPRRHCRRHAALAALAQSTPSKHDGGTVGGGAGGVDHWLNQKRSPSRYSLKSPRQATSNPRSSKGDEEGENIEPNDYIEYNEKNIEPNGSPAAASCNTVSHRSTPVPKKLAKAVATYWLQDTVPPNAATATCGITCPRCPCCCRTAVPAPAAAAAAA